MAPTSAVPTVDQRRAKTARRSWWADGLEAAIYLVSAAGVALVIAAGGFTIYQPVDVLYGLGRSAGVVATVFVLTQVLLVSRAPYIERSVGHDRTMALHTRLGKWAIILMTLHASLIIGVSAVYADISPIEQTVAFFTQAWYLALAQIALAIFLVILALSLAIVRRRWRYETWHAVHLMVYVAIGFVVWHQFLFGSTFAGQGPAWWYWLTLYVLAFGSLLVFRFLRPLALFVRHGLRVVSVTPLGGDDNPAGATSVVLSGRRLEKLHARPGQFFLWRFLARGYWAQAHPFSLSAAPEGDTLRITVKASGDFSASVAQLKPGTRVLAEGPLGVFSDVARTQGGLVLVASGIGVTPIRAMLEEHAVDRGPCDVIIRARSEAEAPLLDEVRRLAATRGAAVHVLFGSRGEGWTPAESPTTLAELVPDIASRDVYICGPVEWAVAVEAEAIAAGCAKSALHREKFAW